VREAVADDPVRPCAVGDGVGPEGSGIGDQERDHGGEKDAEERGSRLVERPPRDTGGEEHHREEREGDERELLQRDRDAQARPRPDRVSSREQREREDEG
jgi:hypothetical protein